MEIFNLNRDKGKLEGYMLAKWAKRRKLLTQIPVQPPCTCIVRLKKGKYPRIDALKSLSFSQFDWNCWQRARSPKSFRHDDTAGRFRMIANKCKQKQNHETTTHRSSF